MYKRNILIANAFIQIHKLKKYILNEIKFNHFHIIIFIIEKKI